MHEATPRFSTSCHTHSRRDARPFTISSLTGVYASRRVIPVLVLGFARGWPLALTGGTLQAWATSDNVSLQNLGFLTLIGTAYTLKFLWAPLVDRYAPPVLEIGRASCRERVCQYV